MEVSQLLVWNFNGQGDLTDRGMKRLFLTLDGEALSPPQVFCVFHQKRSKMQVLDFVAGASSEEGSWQRPL